VEVVGPGVQGSLVGTRVVFIDTWNTGREQIVCPVDKLVPVPDGLDDTAAAASYINPLTTWALTRSAHNQGERLAPADGGCLQRRQAGASTGAAVSIQDHQRHPAARAGSGNTRACGPTRGRSSDRTPFLRTPLQNCFSTMLEVIHVGDHRNAVSLKELIYRRIFSPIVNPSFGSLLYSLSYILFCFVPGLVLFRKRIFIKI
jgi:hypothetical protein